METIADIKKRIEAGTRILNIAKEYEAKARADTRNIFREVFTDIEAQALAAEELLKSGKGTPMTGVPVAIKDNILFAGHEAGASSKILEGYVASYDSTVIKKLRDAGAVIIGRTNMDEFAMGSSTENSAYGVTKNPIDETRVPGGSSGGSAAAVAAGLAVVSLGSDTGGSIRQPAAFCGVVGLLPTYGSVSRHGLMAMGSSLDVIGPFTHSIEDAHIVYDCIKGIDQYDSTSRSVLELAAPKKKIAVPKGLFLGGGIDEEVQKNFELILERLKAAGYTIDEIELPHFKNALAVYYILMPAEVSSNLARFDGVRYGPRELGGKINDLYTATRGTLFGKEVRRRILLGTYVLSHGYYDAYYNKALAVRSVIQKELANAFTQYDAIITPTTPSPAFGIGEKTNDPLAMYLSDLFTVPANIAQIPGISIPSGSTVNGLPLGVQLLSAQGAELNLFEIGRDIERIR